MSIIHDHKLLQELASIYGSEEDPTISSATQQHTCGFPPSLLSQNHLRVVKAYLFVSVSLLTSLAYTSPSFTVLL